MSYTEIAPGLRHWTAEHPKWGITVSSYALVDAGVLLNPLLPDGDRSVLDGIEVSAVVLTNRHHLRDSERIAAEFADAVTIHAPSSGLHDLTEVAPPVHGYRDGDELPGGLRAVEIGALSPDEFAVHLPDDDAVAVADGVTEEDGELVPVPDSLMGDDPEAVKRGLAEAYRRVCARLTFSHLLLAHGRPMVGDGDVQLAAYADALADGRF